jgi:hypothetical protein
MKWNGRRKNLAIGNGDVRRRLHLPTFVPRLSCLRDSRGRSGGVFDGGSLDDILKVK